MEVLERLQNVRQSLWMVHASREQIKNDSLLKDIEHGVIQGLFLSPQAVCRTLSRSTVYDDVIIKKHTEGLWEESLAYDLISENIQHEADLLGHVFDRTDGVDGWAVLPVSPLLTADPDRLQQLVSALHVRLNKNILITVPGLPFAGAIGAY